MNVAPRNEMNRTEGNEAKTDYKKTELYFNQFQPPKDVFIVKLSGTTYVQRQY
jgi:hypothetical protein